MDNILNDNYPVYAGEETVTASGYTLLGAMQRVAAGGDGFLSGIDRIIVVLYVVHDDVFL